jgi:hypothetical protein
MIEGLGSCECCGQRTHIGQTAVKTEESKPEPLERGNSFGQPRCICGGAGRWACVPKRTHSLPFRDFRLIDGAATLCDPGAQGEAKICQAISGGECAARLAHLEQTYRHERKHNKRQ